MKGNIEPNAAGVVQFNAPAEWAARANNYALLQRSLYNTTLWAAAIVGRKPRYHGG